MNHIKYTESHVPSNYKVQVRHWHSGNSSRNARNGHEYHTVCKIIDKGTGRVLGIGRSWCSKNDVPSRTLGRQVAVGRALKQAFNTELNALGVVA